MDDPDGDAELFPTAVSLFVVSRALAVEPQRSA